MMTGLTGEREDRNELVSALFALITARLEDAAALAARGQNRKIPPVEIMDLTGQIMSSNEAVSILLRAAVVVLPQD